MAEAGEAGCAPAGEHAAEKTTRMITAIVFFIFPSENGRERVRQIFQEGWT